MGALQVHRPPQVQMCVLKRREEPPPGGRAPAQEGGGGGGGAGQGSHGKAYWASAAHLMDAQ